MADFSSGVSVYVTGRYEIKVNFPIDLKGRPDVSCNQCPYYGRSAKICYLNKHTPVYPEKYIGQECPIKFEDEYTDKGENNG